MQANVLKLHVTQLYVSVSEKNDCKSGKKNTEGWFVLVLLIGCITEKRQKYQSMKGGFPRDCIIRAYFPLLAKHINGRRSPEDHGHRNI